MKRRTLIVLGLAVAGAGALALRSRFGASGFTVIPAIPIDLPLVPADIIAQLPPEVAARPAVDVVIINGTLQATATVDQITPIYPTVELYEMIAGRELSSDELAQMPPLVLYPDGTLATYIPPLVSTSALSIIDAQAVVTGETDIYALSGQNTRHFLATITFIVRADRDYPNVTVHLLGASLIVSEEEEFFGNIATGGAKFVNLPRGESSYSFSTVWQVNLGGSGFSVFTGGGIASPWGSVEGVVSSPGGFLQRRTFNLQAELKSQIEALLGVPISIGS